MFVQAGAMYVVLKAREGLWNYCVLMFDTALKIFCDRH